MQNNSMQVNQNKIAALKSYGTLNTSPQLVQDPLFKNEAFFDPYDIVQVKYELLRRVQIEGVSITTAVKNFGFSRLSFYRISSIFKKLGLPGFIPKKRGPRQAHKLTPKILEFVNKQIASNASVNSITLKCLIKKQFNLSIHTCTIERAMFRKKKELIVNKVFYNSTGIEELIKYYEALRTSVLTKCYFNNIYNSSVIFLRGMAAWINTFSIVDPINKT